MISIKNNTGETKTYEGQEILPGAYYIIEAMEELGWKNNSDLLKDIALGKAIVSDGQRDITDINEAINFLKSLLQSVVLNERKTTDQIPMFSLHKSYRDSSRSFTTPDYSNPLTWYFDVTKVTGEVLTRVDSVTYQSSRLVPEWNHYWIKWERIPNNARMDYPFLKVKVYRNSVLLPSGYLIDYTNGKLVFLSPQDSGDVISVDYCYGKSADFELSSIAGKRLLVDYVEVQFSVGCQFNEESPIVFEAVYNGPALPENSLYVGFPGYPANTDLVLKQYSYFDADDFLNEATGVQVGEPFGRLLNKYCILPWNYLTGHTLLSPGNILTDLGRGEFNKFRVRKIGNKIVQNCELATCTFYCKMESI